jgi:hypothetical protein
MKTVFRQAYLIGESNRSDHQGVLNGQYDLMILSSSWDGRSICITSENDVRAKHSILLLFDFRDNSGLRDKHDKMLIDYCNKKSEFTNPIRGHSIDIENIWSQIYAKITEIAGDLRRPLRVLMDISSCPRYYFCAATAVGFSQALVENMTFLYAEGKYPDSPSDREIAFTGSRWKTVAIPGLFGEFEPEKKRFYLVSVGFEGWKTLRVISRQDPDRISVLFPDPGFVLDYPERTHRNNKDLLTQYQIPDEQIVRAHAGDAIAAWKELSVKGVERPLKENVFYLCSGTKPHSLALTLRAITLGYPAVLYNLPDEHVVVPMEPNGKFWIYTVSDVTSLNNKRTVTR